MTTKTTKTTNMQRRQSKAASPKFSIAHKGCLAGVSPLEEEAKAIKLIKFVTESKIPPLLIRIYVLGRRLQLDQIGR